MRKHIFCLCLFSLLVLSVGVTHAQSMQARFVENKGQWHPNIAYLLRLYGGDMLVEKNRFVFKFMEEAYWEPRHKHEQDHQHEEGEKPYKGHAYYVNFLHANPNVLPKGENAYPELTHYYYGNQPENWAENVLTYPELRYENLWQGIDAHLYAKDGQLKYDFIIHANQGNPSDIELLYEGLDAEKMHIDPTGNLVITTEVRTITELKPVAFQYVNGQKVEVGCAYKISEDHQLTFELGNYDPNYDLIIDPTLIFSTYTGSTQDNWGFTATYDNAGNAYGGGIVWNLGGYFIGQTGYPTTPGAIQTGFQGGDRDAAITKYNPAGTNVIFSTYLGGTTEENPHSMVVNGLGELIVLGRTNSLNFPITANAFDNTINGGYDIYLAKFNPTGTLQTCTFLGGSGDDGMNGTLIALPTTYNQDFLNYNYADDARGEVVVDANDDVYLVGCTNSQNFPTTAGCYQNFLGGGRDAVVAKFNPNLTNLLWSTYYGGSDLDAGYGIKIDGTGNVVITGGTRSLDLPTSVGSYQAAPPGGLSDGFIAKLNANGTVLLNATYIGTGSMDQSYFVELDAGNNIYVTGQTLGNFPIINATYSVANSRQFIVKLNPTLTNALYSTTFGSPGAVKPNISPTAFLVDVCENVYVAGWGGQVQSSGPGGVNANAAGGGSTTGMPVTANAIKSTTDGSDFYVIVLEPNASGLLYATYFGGNTGTEHVDGGTSRFNPAGIIYEAVCASCGALNPASGGFPTTPGVWSTTNNSPNCNLGLFKIDLGFVQVASAISAPASACVNAPVNFTNNSTGATTYTWDFGDGSPLSNAVNPTHTYTVAGTYTVTLIANPATAACSIPDTASVQIQIEDLPVPDFSYPAALCIGDTATLTYTGTPAATYTWNFGGATVLPPSNINSPGPIQLVINANTTVTLTSVTSAAGCQSVNPVSYTINIIPLPTSDFTLTDTVCGQQPAIATYTGNAPASATYSWTYSGGASATPGGTVQGPQSITFPNQGNQTVTLVVQTSSGCVSPPTTLPVFVGSQPVINLLMPDSTCVGQPVTVTYVGSSGANVSYNWNFGGATGGNPNIGGPQNLTWNAAGTYTIWLWIDEGLGCVSDTVKRTVTVNPLPTSTFTNTSPVCFGDNVTVNYTGNASATATYNWNLGGLTATPNPPTQNFVLSGFPNPGTFPISLVVTEKGCTGPPTNANLVVNPIPIADFFLPDSACAGLPVTLTYQGSTTIPNLNYHWNFGGGTGGNPNTQGPHNVQWNSAGTYTVTLWVEANGCISDTIQKDIVIRQGPPADIIAIPKDICLGDVTTVSYLGLQNSSFTYQWNFAGGTATTGTGAGPHQVLFGSAGIKNISLTIYDDGCPGIPDTAVVMVYAPPVASFAFPNNVCVGDPNQVVFTGVGTPNAFYDWNFGSAVVISGSGMGPYTLSWDTPGTHTICVQVTEPVCPPSAVVCNSFTLLPLPIADIAPVANQCFANNSFSFTYTGTPNPTSYSWGFPGGIPSSSAAANPTGIQYLSPGLYEAWVAVTKDGCRSDTARIYFEVIPEANANFSFAGSPYCVGSCVNFTYTGTPTYPLQAYSWTFQNGNPQFSTLQDVSCVQFMQPGNQNVTLIVDNRGCKDTAQASVPVFPTPNVDAGTDVNFCQGTGPVPINASVSGGTLPYFYQWTSVPAAGGISNPTIEDPTVNPSVCTNYFLLVQDANGCSSNQDTVKICPIPQPKITAGPDLKYCKSPTSPGVQLQASILPPTTGFAPYHYSWTPFVGMNLGEDTLLNPVVNPPTTTIYTLVVTNKYGCSSDPLDTAATVIVDVVPIPTVNAGPFTAICKGDTTQLLGSAAGGNGTYDFTWTSAIPNGNIFDIHNPTSLANPAHTHTYVLVAESEGCYGSDTVTVFVHTLPTAAVNIPEAGICQGDSVWIEGMASGDPFANIYTYSWVPSTNVSNPNAAGTWVYPTSSQTYNLQVGTANCKGFVAAIPVNVFSTPLTNISTQDTSICAGDTIQLMMDYGFSGTPVGSPAFITWTPNAGMVGSPQQQNPLVAPMQSGYYTAQVQVGGCKTTDQVYIQVVQPPKAAIAADTTRICQGENLPLTALGGYAGSTYSWLPANDLSNPFVSNPVLLAQTSGSYLVWIKEGNCVDSASLYVQVLPQPIADYGLTNPRGCAPVEVFFTQNATDALSYTWNFGDGSPVSNEQMVSHIYTQTGIYNVSLTVMGLNGCKDEVSLNPVVVYPTPIADFTSNPPGDSVIQLPYAQIQFFDQSQNASSWFWDFGNGYTSVDNNPVYGYVQAGEYLVLLRVKNENGCVDEIQKRYKVLAPGLFIPNTFTPNGDGIHDLFEVVYEGNERYFLEIYDRWGVRYFVSEKPSQRWDGSTMNGKVASDGTYYYSLRIGEKVYNGFITLLK